LALRRKAIAAIVNVTRIIATVQCHFIVAAWRAKQTECVPRETLEIIADNLKKVGWSLGRVLAVNR
jgi:hypothetical protein